MKKRDCGFWTLRRKMIIVLTMEIIILLVVLSYATFRMSKGIIMRRTLDSSEKTLDSAMLKTQDYFSNSENILKELMYKPEIEKVLNNENGNLQENYEDGENIDTILRITVLSHKELHDVCLISDSGKYYRGENTKVNTDNSAVPYDELRAEAIANDGRVCWEFRQEDGKLKDIYCMQQIKNIELFHDGGVLVLRLDLGEFVNMFSGVIKDDSESIIFLDKEGNNILNIGNDKNIMQEECMQKLSPQRGSAFIGDKRVVLSFDYLKNYKIMILAESSLDPFYKDVEHLGAETIIISALLLLLFSGFTLFAVHNFTEPINKMIDTMRKRKNKGELVKIDLHRKDEFGILENRFNTMVTEINDLTIYNYRERLTRREAELAMLQAQINPHFLFNTLEAMNLTAQMHGINELSSMITSLAAIMSESMDIKDKKLNTIEDEIRYIYHYFNIMQIRFGDGLKIIKNYDRAIYNVNIPKLLIQPLIENALHHGLERKSGKNKVVLVSIRREGKFVHVIVADNGIGMDEEQLENIRDRLKKSAAEELARNKRGRRGIGIENVNIRLKLYYGEEYGMILSSKKDFYTKSEFYIPVDAPGNEEEKNDKGSFDR